MIVRYHNTYRVRAVGKPPDSVLEIASRSAANNYRHDKRDRYAQIGIGEYWRYDPTGDSRHYHERWWASGSLAAPGSAFR